MSPSHLLPVPMSPCLVLNPDGITQEGRTILLDPKGESVTCDIEPLGSNMSFALTWKGWILSSDQNDFCTFLYDPRTCDKIELPRFVHPLPRTFEYALSDKPTDTGCVVVILHPDEPCLWYCRIGGPDEWIKYDYDVGNQQYDIKGLVWKKAVITSLTSCKGKFYFPILGLKQGVLEFNPSPVTHVVTMRGLPEGGFSAYTCSFELEGEPYHFYAFEDYRAAVLTITDIMLYKVDLVGQRFIEVDGIGDRALLWSGFGGGCCPAMNYALKPNCVYWIKNGSMHIFNIVDGTHRVCDQPSEDLSKLSSKAFWLLPTN